MQQRDRNQVRREIEDAKASMGAKLEALSERVEGVRERMSLQRQIAQRPLLFMGLSVAAGFVLQRLMGRWHYRRAAPYILDQVRQVAQSTAEYVASAARAAAEGRAHQAVSGEGSSSESTSMMPRPERSLPARLLSSKMLPRKMLINVAAKAVLANLTRTLMSMAAKRLRHRGRGHAWEGEPDAPVVMDVRDMGRGYETLQSRK